MWISRATTRGGRSAGVAELQSCRVANCRRIVTEAYNAEDFGSGMRRKTEPTCSGLELLLIGQIRP